MNRSSIDFWVGVFVLLGAAAVVFLALRVGNLTSLGSPPAYLLEARFDNIGGLKPRAPVKAAGVIVGRVDTVRLDPQTYQAVVGLRIDLGYQFSKDTIASINTSGLLGDAYIGLDSGGDPTMLADGGKIAKTQSAIVLEKLISQFMFSSANNAGGGSNAAAAGAAPAGAPK
jgi:phospholipid/cholesterol/gamma-HCH transport system substrate-binding protein